MPGSNRQEPFLDQQGLAERMVGLADGGLSSLDAFELLENFGADLVGNEVEHLAAQVKAGASVRSWRKLLTYRCVKCRHA